MVKRYPLGYLKVSVRFLTRNPTNTLHDCMGSGIRKARAGFVVRARALVLNPLELEEVAKKMTVKK
jgi:hypothetical protein